jgi:hypothetical protein
MITGLAVGETTAGVIKGVKTNEAEEASTCFSDPAAA